MARRNVDKEQESNLSNEEADQVLQAMLDNPIPRNPGGLDHVGVPGSVSTEYNELDHETSQLEDLRANAQRIPIEKILKEVGEDKSVLQADPRTRSRHSTVPVVNSPVALSQSVLFEAQAAVAAQGVLENPDAVMWAKGNPQLQLSNDEIEHVAKVSKALSYRSSPDVKVYAGKRVVTLPGSVRDVPNKLDFEQATGLMEAIFNDDEVVHLVVKAAQHSGQETKPAMWLSQQIAHEVHQPYAWQSIEKDMVEGSPPYRLKEEGPHTTVWEALNKLFDEPTCEQIDGIASRLNLSLLVVTKLLAARVSRARIAVCTGIDTKKSKYAV